MNPAFTPNLATTGIGSMPFTDAEQAAAFLLNAGLTIPFWPQMPKRSFTEEMVPQCCRGIPGVCVDALQRSVILDPTRKMTDLETFYTRYLAGDSELFAMNGEEAAGFYAFERAAGTRTWPVVKGQITGPVTLGVSICDADKQPLLGDEDLRDAAVKTLARQAAWQISRLQRFASERVLLFVDEPVLAAFGSSSYLYLSEPVVSAMLGEVFSAITEAGAITAIHVCGNSDWGMVARTGVQVINFDAYQYGERMALYAGDLKPFFDRGGCIAWGIVPTTAAIREETADGLTGRLDRCFDALVQKGFPRSLLIERAILTPSCGTGSLGPDDTRRVFELLAEVQGKTRKGLL